MERVKGGEGKRMFLSLKLDFQTVLQLSLALSFISEPLYLDSAELDEIRCIPCIKRKYKTISNILLLNIFSFIYSKKPCFDKELFLHDDFSDLKIHICIKQPVEKKHIYIKHVFYFVFNKKFILIYPLYSLIKADAFAKVQNQGWELLC